MLEGLEREAGEELSSEGVAASDREAFYQIDVRYRGQGMSLPIDVKPDEFRAEGLRGLTDKFDAEHAQLFTFALDAEHEVVGLRAVVQGPDAGRVGEDRTGGAEDASVARIQPTRIYADGMWHDTIIYDRSKLQTGNRVAGPAIVTEMDSTSLILPHHVGVVDRVGNILIWPEGDPRSRQTR